MMRFVAALLALQINGGIASAILGRLSSSFIIDETLRRCPCVDLGVVDRETVVRNRLLPFRAWQHPGEGTMRQACTK